MSPEICQGDPYSEASDVWAFGVTLWELLEDAGLPFALVQSDETVAEQVQIQAKYQGYIDRQQDEIEKPPHRRRPSNSTSVKTSELSSRVESCRQAQSTGTLMHRHIDRHTDSTVD